MINFFKYFIYEDYNDSIIENSKLTAEIRSMKATLIRSLGVLLIIILAPILLFLIFAM